MNLERKMRQKRWIKRLKKRDLEREMTRRRRGEPR